MPAMAAPRTKEDTFQATMQSTRRDAERLLNMGVKEFERWYGKQAARTKLGVLLATLLAAVLIVNLFLGAVGRVTSRPTPVQTAAQTAAGAPRSSTTPLAVELAPNDAGKAWALSRAWQGHGPFQSDQFTVSDHWRVDWLFSPNQPGAAFQVFIHAATGGARLQIATNTHIGGADSSFWVGPGAYYLVVNTVGGEWKLDVQELH